MQARRTAILRLGAMLPSQTQSASSQPLVWLLMGNRAGDNSQVLGLGEALGWPLEEKHFVYTGFEKFVNLPFGAHLLGVVRDQSSKLEGPWPDLVISAGRKNEPIARYIRQRADKPVRLVHVGRPWARVETWDLVITTPQYRLPNEANVLHNDTPLHRVTRDRLDLAAEAWRERVAHLPRPFVVVLAGGNSGPYPFDRASGERLATGADALARELGGSILVTTSARTLDETTDALFDGIKSPAILYRWRKDDADNPFFAFLGLADRVIVTADSVSMMTEACATGRPVYLFDTGEGRTSMKHNPWLDGVGESAQSAERATDDDEPSAAGFNRWHLKAHVYRLTMRLGPQRLTRDIRIVQRLLVDTDRAIWLGDGHPSNASRPLEDVCRAVDRVRQLFETPSNHSVGGQGESVGTRSSTSNASCRT
jgi:mitochondrial fission protein ELM1